MKAFEIKKYEDDLIGFDNGRLYSESSTDAPDSCSCVELTKEETKQMYLKMKEYYENNKD